MNPKILLIDDDALTLATHRDTLQDHGFDVTEVQTRAQATDALDNRGPWDVIVLDEYLSGPGGTATATEMLADIAARAPEARVIVLTGYASVAMVRSAVAAGAWDYLQKDAEYLEILLPLRVRHAVEAARERRLRRVAPDALEQELRDTWIEALRPGQDPHRKGRLLEETLALLFRTIPGLDDVRLNRRGLAEEFDVVVLNRSDRPLLSKEGHYFLVECKHWAKPVDPKELDVLRAKLRDRFGRAKLGLLIGISGFTPGVTEKLARWTNEETLVLLLDRDQLSAWIDATDRARWLEERVLAASLRAHDT